MFKSSDGIQGVRTGSWNAGIISEPVLAFCYRPVVLNRGSVEPQEFDEAVSRVRWTLSDILIY